MAEPIYSDAWLSVYQGDSREVLMTLPEQSVHCVITSPPYFGLRDYGTATWEGGDPLCDHKNETAHQKQGATSQRAGRSNAEEQRNENFRGECGKCGAIRVDAQIGLEDSPRAYVADMVDIFRGIRRVLRDDGTVWLNIGDSYNNRAKVRTSSHQPSLNGFEDDNWQERAARGGVRMSSSEGGLKEKDLLGIPWRVAFALQDDGWYLRADCIWSKPNPMPSSVTDRPSISHEYMFLLAKKERYFYDIDATREPHKPISLNRIKYGLNQTHPDGIGVAVPPVRTTQIEGADNFDTAQVTREAMGDRFANPLGRNMRSVWEVATVPYPGAHYAVFPPKLIEPCVKASTSEKGVCPECGAQWVRIIEETDEVREDFKGSSFDSGKTGSRDGGDRTQPGDRYVKVPVGWKPSCAHDAEPVPATILDPFAGSGTVGKVAQAFSRRAVLIDLNTEYLEQQLTRNAQVPLGL